MALLAVGVVAMAPGHGSMLLPPPRNAIDAELPAWANASHPMTGTIEPYNCRCTNGTSPCANGQACFWFSQGCTVGCARCDGNGSRIPNWDHCPGEGLNMTHPGRLLKQYWTANQNALVGSVADVFKHNPWRAPGLAPVSDPCGMAGGVPVESFNAAAYNATPHAKQGDLGSVVLPKRPTGTVWRRGRNATVRWQQTADHGGGYQYRLCPADQQLTEACFQQTPLKFTNSHHWLRFADPTLDRAIPATVVAAGGGLGWMRYPIPPRFATCDYVVVPPAHCEYKCPGCGAPKFAADSACPATSCADYYPGTPRDVAAVPEIFPDPVPGMDMHAYAIEDTVEVPFSVPPGEYVVGWRWDCEQTTQIWQSCADITVV
mmetsp:Transcript_33210/g.86951  ORF Transcript_33210/g.86951 Transcript_33210/m.86951 type:complete len:374 (+) Transcript_33210:25-1146(+)